jgi:hypothetical protein
MHLSLFHPLGMMSHRAIEGDLKQKSIYLNKYSIEISQDYYEIEILV